MHTKVTKGLHELPKIDASLKPNRTKLSTSISQCSWHNDKRRRPSKHLVHLLETTHTCILPVDGFHHKFQIFLVVLQIVNKLLKVQLFILAAFFTFEGFLNVKKKEAFRQ